MWLLQLCDLCTHSEDFFELKSMEQTAEMWLSRMEALSFFLQKGHYSFRLSSVSIIAQYVILIILTSLAVRGSAKQAARMSPAAALRTIK